MKWLPSTLLIAMVAFSPSLLVGASGASPISEYAIEDLGTFMPESINERGEVVGNYSSGAALYRRGQFMYLKDIIPSGSGWDNLQATGINGRGQIIGYGSFGGLVSGFVYTNGTITDLGSYGGRFVFPWAINNSGQMALILYPINSGLFRAGLYSHGVITDLTYSAGLVGLGDRIVQAINERGDVVGYGLEHPGGIGSAGFAVYSNGAPTLFGYDNEHTSEFHDINNKQQIVGSRGTGLYEFERIPHAFLYSEGSYTDLGTLGGLWSVAYAINERGWVVGHAETSAYVYHAFLYANRSLIDLNALIPDNSGWELQSAIDINNAGQIIGYGNINGETHGFVASPVPVPKGKGKEK